MFRDEKLELKVGLFMGMGIFLMFLIVFSISDFYSLKKGYEVRVVFDYVNGITKNSPARLAGVHVGEIKDIEIYYDGDVGRTRVRLHVWIEANIQIEGDALAQINTLGLLGEQYLEISPGTIDRYLKPGDTIVGRNPVNVGEQMENMRIFVETATEVFDHLAKGKGTLGKLIVKDNIYNDLEDLASDLKAHPWKLLSKPSGASRKAKRKKKEK